MSGKIIVVNGRRWFDRRWGNTYHSVEVNVNGDFVGSVDFDYGYGDHYLTNAHAILEKVYPEYKEAYEGEALWRAVERNGDKLVNFVTDVSRKRDL